MTTPDDRFEELLNARAEEEAGRLGRATTTLQITPSASTDAAQQPYLVFLSNLTGQDLNWQIFYGKTGDPNIEETGRKPIPNNSQDGFQLGGPGDCNRVTAYRLLVDDGNQIVGDTGGVAAHQNPATPCVDVYVIQ